MVNKTNVGSLNPVKGWLAHWQEERRDGNDLPTSVCNVTILRKEAVVNEIFRGLTEFEVDTELVIYNNPLGHTESMAFLG